MAPTTPTIVIPPAATQCLLVLRKRGEGMSVGDTYLAVLWFGEVKEMCASLKVKPAGWVPDLQHVQLHRQHFPDLWKRI